MVTNGLLTYMENAKETRTILEALARNKREQLVYGLSGSQKGLMAAAIHQVTGRPMVVITAYEDRARQFGTDLATLLPGENPLVFPALDLAAHQVVAASKETVQQRLTVLSRCHRGEARVITTSVEALMRRIAPPLLWVRGCIDLSVGREVNLEELIARLVGSGYRREGVVEGFGQFSIRGAIVDVYPPGSPEPVRIELFDREVDSIRYFDPVTQRSLSGVRSVGIPPAQEFAVNPGQIASGMKQLERDLQSGIKRLTKAGKTKAARKLSGLIKELQGNIQGGLNLDELAPYFPYFCPESATLVDYLSEDAIIFLDEPARILEAANRHFQDVTETYLRLFEDGIALPGQARAFFGPDDLWSILKVRQLVFFSLLPKSISGVSPEQILNVAARNMGLFHGRQDELAHEVAGWQRKHYATAIFASTNDRAERVVAALNAAGLKASRFQMEDRLTAGDVAVFTGDLQEGFEMPSLGLALVTDQEIFGKERKKRRPAQRHPEGRRIEAFTELKAGDYVVHVNHGIGRYLGVQRLQADGVERDYLVIRYSGEDRLYVPTDQLELIQKYIATDGHAPKLNRLGGSEWTKAKNKVKHAVQEMAGELLALYAARESVPGFPYSPDSIWQREFEEAFPYEETPDQLQSIHEVKGDMMKPRPMDRLLCGDVGYGKTEVAIRAAFKAVMDNRQVAILVPTTILAQQHYNTFRERLAGYPVTVEVLSRFRSHRQQTTVIDKLALGMVDVIIGTHRLLSEDVQFNNLGLLIVDEEHRFGVVHKERLKQLRTNVDVLTLTATPIPRTLHMALVGVRDMSTIETPPEDRYPVQTYVAERTPELIRDAIARELGRGGQVFFVHNKILDIERAASEIRMLVPEARIGVAHGQMKEDRLEQVMLDFLEGNYDILVTTTIIESGLDMPNVNTLIVDDADHLGLAQLYQLRGRVGRSNRRAYSYFTYRRDKVLTEVAEKRLHAIREFTEFGSGFKIAMRDLEIRGAGNILGPEQHGHIMAVGFDLYCQMLEEAVGELKGSVEPKLVVPALDVRVDSFIPDEYVSDPGQKVEIYKRLSLARSKEEVDDLAAEMQDRFGEVPLPLANLLAVTRIRVMAQELDIASIQQERDTLRIRFHRPPATGENLVKLAGRFRNRISFSVVHGLDVNLKLKGLQPEEVVKLLETFFAHLKSLAGVVTV